MISDSVLVAAISGGLASIPAVLGFLQSIRNGRKQDATDAKVTEAAGTTITKISEIHQLTNGNYSKMENRWEDISKKLEASQAEVRELRAMISDGLGKSMAVNVPLPTESKAAADPAKAAVE